MLIFSSDYSSEITGIKNDYATKAICFYSSCFCLKNLLFLRYCFLEDTRFASRNAIYSVCL